MTTTRKRKRDDEGSYGYKKRRTSKGYFRMPLKYTPSSKTNTALVRATNAMLQLRKLKKEEEVKYLTTTATITIAAAVGTTTWQVSLLNGMAQGSAGNERIGTKITIKSIQVRIEIYTATNIGTPEPNFRWAVVYDRKPDRVALTGAQVFDVDNILGNINTFDKRYRGRFQILHDEISDGDSQEQYHYSKCYIQKTLKCHYYSTGATIANIDKGSIYMMVCKGPVATTSDSALRFNCKISYTDA